MGLAFVHCLVDGGGHSRRANLGSGDQRQYQAAQLWDTFGALPCYSLQLSHSDLIPLTDCESAHGRLTHP